MLEITRINKPCARCGLDAEKLYKGTNDKMVCASCRNAQMKYKKSKAKKEAKSKTLLPKETGNEIKQ